MTSTVSGRNVILVVMDSVRADVFHNEAQNFRRLSESGLRFTKAIAPATWTLPSHVSMLTGLAPSEHGAVATGTSKIELRTRVSGIVKGLADEGALLAPRLKGSGVRTFSATPNPWLGPLTRLDIGFDERRFFAFLDRNDRQRARPKTKESSPTRVEQARGLARAVGRHAQWIARGTDKGAARILDDLVGFVDGHEGPFFALVNLIEAHEPHVPPRAQRRWTDRDFLAVAFNAVLQPGPVRARRIRRHNWGSSEIPRSTLRRWKSAYRAEIRHLDGWLSDLTEHLKRTGRLANTVVIATSDHGENFGEQGIVGHGFSLHESTAHVPLAMWGGGLEPTDIAQPVGLAKLRATIEHLVLDEDIGGSLIESSSWGTAAIEIEDPAHVNRPPERASKTTRGPGAAFYDDGLKLVDDPFEGTMLLDLDKDPAGNTPAAITVTPTEEQHAMHEAWRERVSGRAPLQLPR